LVPDGTIQQNELRINIAVIGELDGLVSSRSGQSRRRIKMVAAWKGDTGEGSRSTRFDNP
jgi:hypothetical protein